jgi:DNA-binding transcriptional regulator YdaS (Cro superfamily)
MSYQHAIQKAVEVCGSQSELGRRVGVAQGHVWYWLKTGKVSPLKAKDVERATQGAVTAEELRPDVFT